MEILLAAQGTKARGQIVGNKACGQIFLCETYLT